eukprot:UN11206
MQTSTRRRRTTNRLNTDNYDPKSKSNSKKQKIYIIIGVIIFIIGALILYKTFSLSDSTNLENTNINNNYSENEVENIENIEKKQNNIPNIPNIPIDIPNMKEINEKARKTMFGG